MIKHQNPQGGKIHPLKQFLKNQYQPISETAPITDGFFIIEINGKRFAVSNLITIGEFKSFMSNNADYSQYRKRLEYTENKSTDRQQEKFDIKSTLRQVSNVDNWMSVNQDDDTLPASVTWYDAMAYTAWTSKNNKLPVRLLNETEFRNIATCLIPLDIKDYFSSYIDKKNDDIIENPNTILKASLRRALKKRLCIFSHTDGTPIDGHPPYMPEEEFQSLIFKYDMNELKWKESETGLRFINSPYFGEWLQPQGAAINCWTLASLMSSPTLLASPSRMRFSPLSTGKYKSRKIGFRMIYEIG